MPLPPRLPALRDDIEIFPSGPSALGTPSWRLYDPVRNRFFQIGEAEFNMLAHWHLGSPSALLAALAAAMPMAPDEDGLEALLLFLHHHQLLARRDRAATAALAALAPPPTAWSRWLLHNYLFLRVPLANPDRFYGRLAPLLGALFTPGFWALAGALGLLAAGQVMTQWDRFTATFSYAFSVEGALWIAGALALLKCAHEIGHGVAAKRQGLRVTRTGVALLVLWPVLYTDINDIWKLADWRGRLQVSVAGIATELLCAILATLGWLSLSEGPLQSALFIIASTAWILSLAINLNPFMRFDGYYLLSDALNYPNLQEDAFQAARVSLRRLIGLDEPLGAGTGLPRRLLAAYGWGIWLYRGLLFAGIAYFLFISLPKLFGLPLALVEIGWFILRPVWAEAARCWPRRAEIAPRRRRGYLAAGAALLLLMTLPWSLRVAAPAYLSADGRASFFAPASARVRAVHVRNGQAVEAGALIAELESPELRARLAQAEARVREAKARLDKAATNAATFDQSDVLQQTLAERMVERDNVSGEMARLTVRAERAGTVRDLPGHIMAGRWLRKNDKLAALIPPPAAARVQIVGYLSETDYPRVRIGARARFFPDGDPFTVIEGRVSGIAVSSSLMADERGLTSLAGGPLPAVRAASAEVLHGAFYAVEVRVEGRPAALERTSTGSLRIASAAYNPLVDALRAALAEVNAELGF